MQLRILGCSGGIGAGLRTTSYLLDGEILLDAGTGVGTLTHDEMRRIRHVFLTHSHLDHIGALPLLVDTIFDSLQRPLVVHGLPETIDALRKHLFNGTLWPDFTLLPTMHNPVMTYQPMQPGERVEVGDRTFEMIPVRHTVPGVAYVVEQDGRSFCFSGDTSTNDTLWMGLNARERLDLLLIECGFPDSNEDIALLAKHYTPRMLAEDLRKLRHRPRLAITHLKPGGEQESWEACVATIRGFEMIRVLHDMVLEI